MKKDLRVLITGSTGLLGLSLIRNKPAGFAIYAGYYNFPKEQLPYSDKCQYLLFDIRKRDEVSGIFKDIAPDFVVHAASLGNVDYCENHKEEAWETNVVGSRNMIAASKRYGALLLFMSSNAVFDGEHPPYAEGDKPNPVDYYGKTKLQTEQDLMASGMRRAIIRLMTMYGWNHPLERQNPVTWMLAQLIKNKHIDIVDDIYNNHLFVDSAAEAIWAVMSKNKEGIFHIAGRDIISRYELGCKVAQIFGLDKKLIRPVNSSFFPSIAPRPKNTSYKIDKMEKELAIRAVDIHTGLMLMKGNRPKELKYDSL